MFGFFKKWRIFVILIPCFVFLIITYSKYASLSMLQHVSETRIPASVERGSIVDRHGMPLAVQTNFYHMGATPKLINKPDEFASLVAPVLNMDKDEIERKIEANRKSSFIYIKKKISQDQYEELSKLLSEKGLLHCTTFDRIPGRIYPQNALASQLIGYMGSDGRGLSGIEYSRNSVLSPQLDENSQGTIHGSNVYLTIDAGLQYKLEKIAAEAMASTQAENLMLIAAKAKTGEILSYISLPSADLNNYGNATGIQTMDRPSITAYEPGSVFKIFSVASFLDSGIITGDDSFLCDGVFQKRTGRGELIRITCLDHHGWLNARTSLKYSCNDAIVQMSELMDTNAFLGYIKKFGFGERTGVELPSETRGSVKNQNDKYWSGRSKATMSIGQEMSASAIQMVQAATVLANKGVMVKLSFIEKIEDNDGTISYHHETQYGDRVLKPATADYILSCMETTAQSGTGTKASLGDISIGVKTGTAQMADPVNGGYSDTDFVSNCMAVFPVKEPEIILYIVIEKAKGETYAGRIVAPVIAKAADEIIDHLGISREGAASLEHSGKITIRDTKPLSVDQRVPNFIGRSKRDLYPLLENDSIRFRIFGEGWVKRQEPQAGTPVTENMTIELYLE